MSKPPTIFSRVAYPPHSLLPFDNFQRRQFAWGGYVFECVEGYWYVGISKDVDARIRQHLHGRGSKFTKKHRPIRLTELYFGMTHNSPHTWEHQTIHQLQKIYGKRKVGGFRGPTNPSPGKPLVSKAVQNFRDDLKKRFPPLPPLPASSKSSLSILDSSLLKPTDK